MQPTNKLRFVKREVLVPQCGENAAQERMILQQWWTDTYGKGEWRDVPVENE